MFATYCSADSAFYSNFFFCFHFPKGLVLVFVLFRIGQQILERFFLTGNEPCTYGTGLKLVRIFRTLEKVVPLSNNSLLYENMCEWEVLRKYSSRLL